MISERSADPEPTMGPTTVPDEIRWFLPNANRTFADRLVLTSKIYLILVELMHLWTLWTTHPAFHAMRFLDIINQAFQLQLTEFLLLSIIVIIYQKFCFQIVMAVVMLVYHHVPFLFPWLEKFDENRNSALKKNIDDDDTIEVTLDNKISRVADQVNLIMPPCSPWLETLGEIRLINQKIRSNSTNTDENTSNDELPVITKQTSLSDNEVLGYSDTSDEDEASANEWDEYDENHSDSDAGTAIGA
ncbi:MAG: hypothetical protein Q9220_001119 [cf. Caloplaca sp. 1 TL-2023]